MKWSNLLITYAVLINYSLVLQTYAQVLPGVCPRHL